MTTETTHSTQRSAELTERALALTPGGVHSNVRLTGPKVFLDHGKGSRLVDVDGNEYIDYLLGQGPNFLGHAPDDILAAVSDACRRGMIYGAQHELELEAAERMLGALGWADHVRFGLSGTEAVQAAFRAARAFTGRDKVVRFAGQYHGWLDDMLVAVGPDGEPLPVSEGQLASRIADSIMVPWNDLSVLERLLDARGGEVAAVIMEPVMLNAGSIEPRAGYLEGVRELCTRHGAVLIFDEVIAGFRVALGGAAERYGVTPDLATYGKAMAGGWPVSALAGRAELMEGFGTGRVNHSGTFNANVMGCAATAATLKRLVEDPPYAKLATVGTRLQEGLRSLGADYGLDLNVQGLPMAFHVGFGQGPVESYADLQRLDLARYARFSQVLVEHGVWVTGRGIWYVSAAHTADDVDETLVRVEAAMAAFTSV
jgi:glutamate-1-semialdehyde 2,1-aminomutase